MAVDIETRHLILGAHLFVGAGFLALGGLGLAAGQTPGGVLRVAIGLLVVGVGVYLYRLRSRR